MSGWFDLLHDAVDSLDYLAIALLQILVVVYFVMGVDDVFIDLFALLGKLGPRELKCDDLDTLSNLPEKHLAIIVPAWKESSIIRRMLLGNCQRIAYQSYTFFVGVYPNDPDTLREVQLAAQQYPNIVPVINERNGPSSKGQILNHVAQHIVARIEQGESFDALIMHDAEDMIHPLGLHLMNRELNKASFIQIPIFSLLVDHKELVAGTYIDEFAELHTKDILVRGALGAAIPSAGVGTAIAMPLVRALQAQDDLFRESTLTEDYDLGVRAKKLGFRCAFACYFFRNGSRKEFIATREYFPKRFKRSVRQKTRWTVGIVLQGWRNLGWHGSSVDRFFLYRDRKGLIGNIASLCGYLLLLYLGLRAFDLVSPHLNAGQWLQILLWGNVIMMINRLWQRCYCVARVYGIQAALVVPVRWPICILINALAGANAIRQDIVAYLTKTTVAWAKTDHELPASFGDVGQPSVSASSSDHTTSTATVVQIFLVMFCLLGAQKASAKCVQIFYDRAPQAQSHYYFGRQHAMMLQNLLGHFPHIQQYVKPIEMYETGDLEKCAANIYLGTYFDNKVPNAFYQDYATTKNNVLWAGYNIWKLEPDILKQLWGVKYKNMTTLDKEHLDSKGRPTFFKFYEYKGQDFFKYGEWDHGDSKRFNAAFEIVNMELLNEDAKQGVLSWARHETSGERIPYLLRNGNHWYMADSPFSFIIETDRYLIMADILFDVLDEKPRRPDGPKLAAMRFEDIHALVEPWQLFGMTNLAEKMRVPMSISIIPIFSDPFGSSSADPEKQFVPLTANPIFLDFLRYALQRNVRFIYHGVTHQLGFERNPFTGQSGDDFEFWDRVNNRPVRGDSPEFVIKRLEDGMTILHRAGVKPFAWLSPHYQSSPLDYTLFGELFTWNVGRVIYFPTQKSIPKRLPEAMRFDVAGALSNGQRLRYLQDVKVNYTADAGVTGQFYPYEIYGDVYGQRILPENIGNVQPYMNEQVYRLARIEDLILHFKLNSVIRDSWASFFIHPFCLNDTAGEGVGIYPGDTSKVELLIQEARKAGFEFVDMQKFTEESGNPMRPEPIETKLPIDTN